jgi:hypothetical protein
MDGGRRPYRLMRRWLRNVSLRSLEPALGCLPALLGMAVYPAVAGLVVMVWVTLVPGAKNEGLDGVAPPFPERFYRELFFLLFCFVLPSVLSALASGWFAAALSMSPRAVHLAASLGPPTGTLVLASLSYESLLDPAAFLEAAPLVAGALFQGYVVGAALARRRYRDLKGSPSAAHSPSHPHGQKPVQ